MKKIIGVGAAVLAVFFIYSKIKGGAEIVNLNNPGRSIVCLGDSLTYGHGKGPGLSYPELLAQKVSRPVINLGVNGDTSVGGLSRIDSVFEHNPYMVLIEFGGNDYLKKVPFDRTRQAVGQMADRVQARGAIAVIVDTGGNPFMTQYSKAYKKLAKEKGAVFVPAIMDGIFSDRSLRSDTVHPNAEGYKIVADRVYKGIEKYL